MKKLFATLAAGLFALPAVAQTYPAPTFGSLILQNPLTPANGGTGATSSTGTGSVVLSNSPTLTTPALGTPSAVVLTHGTGLPVSTGVSGLGTGVAAGLANAVTGSGAPVLGTSPTLASPTITGALTATGLVTTGDLATQSANTILSNATGSVASPTALAMPSCSGSNNALRWTSGTGFACASAIALTTSGLNQFASTTSAQLASIVSDETGSGSLVFGTSPTISSPAISGGSINNAPIGATTPNTGSFTTLTGTSVALNNGLTTATAIYQAMFPGQTFSDQAQAVAQTPASNTLGQMTAVAGYVKNVSPTSGINGNAVALFGAGTAEVNNAATWGVNTLLQDAPSRATGTGTGRILLNEYDFNVMNPATEVLGQSIGGNSLAQPTTALGFLVNTLGTGIYWTAGFETQNGAAQIGMSLGAGSATAAANVSSQPLDFQIWDYAGNGQTSSLTAQSNGASNPGTTLVLAGSTTPNNLAITNGAMYLSSATQNYYIGGVPEVGPSTARVFSSNSSGQSIATGTTTTITGWTNAFDQTSSFSASTGVFTAPYTGYYDVSASITYSATMAVGTVQAIDIVSNGSIVFENQNYVPTANAAENTLQAHALVKLASGQTLHITTYQGSGAAVTLNTTGYHNTLSIMQTPG